MKHWTEKFFVRQAELWLHFLDRGWRRNKMTVSAIVKILRKHGIKKGRLLDIACGNGRICIPLARKGFSVTGIDIGSVYIDDARRRASRNRLRADFICGDSRRLDRLVAGTFDAVLSVWTSIGYYDKKTDERLFKTIAGLMRKGALFFVLNTMSQEYLLQHFCTNLFDETDRYVVLHSGNVFDHSHSVNRVKWIFYEKVGRDLRFIDECNMHLRIYSLAEIVEMAEKTGLKFVEAYDSLATLDAAKPDSRLNVVFRKA
ncbi:MAG: class I SAM-dependent methyltransferase [candidate division WOR-3 bacterium]|nr:MAG: class I SAM-dependent methyltransferase [candidate division WOR-3 bacterium]